MAQPILSRSSRGVLALVLWAAFFLRLIWGLLQPSTDVALNGLPDQLDYLHIARNLLHTGQMSFVDRRFDGNLDVYAFRPPGYPLFVAACGANIWVVRFAQAVIDTSTVLAAYLLARRWLSGRAAIVAALLVAVDPLMVHFTSLVLTETLYTALLVWGMVCLTGAGVASLLGGAVLLALSVLVRPGGMLLPIALAAWVVTGRWRAMAVAAAAVFLALLPWAWRNDRQLGQWVWTTTNGGITLYDGFHDGATGASDQSFLRTLPSRTLDDEVERDRWFAQSATAWIVDHPGQALALAARKVVRTWSPVPLSREFSTPLHRFVGLAYGLPFDLLVLAGLLWGRLPVRVKVFLLLPAIYFSVAAALTVSSMRYRLPAGPALAVLAAAALPSRAGASEP